MPDTTRTFIAVAVPATLELKLTRLQAQLAGEAPEVRWEVALPFHVTLAFLGDVDHADLNAVCLAVAEAAAAVRAVRAEARRPRRLPRRRPPAGRSGRASAAPAWRPLNALQAAVAAAVARLDYRPEARPFHPHVTLGRFAARAGARRAT